MSMNRHEELSLIRRAQSGDVDAMSELIDAHQPSLYAFMLRMTGRPEVAEDVVQEAFVRVLKNLDRYDPRFRFSTWLFTIARRLHVNWTQKHAPASETDLVESRASTASQPAGMAAASERRARISEIVDRALSGLNETQREIVLLFHQQEWPITDLARYMRMPEGTIKSHLHRARQRMREIIETENADHLTTLEEVLVP